MMDDGACDSSDRGSDVLRSSMGEVARRFSHVKVRMKERIKRGSEKQTKERHILNANSLWRLKEDVIVSIRSQ